MAVMKCAQQLEPFAYCGSVLLRRTKNVRQMISVLVFSTFLTLVLPYILLSGAALVLLLIFRRREPLRFTPAEVRPGNARSLLCCTPGYVLCLLALLAPLPAPAIAAAVLLFLLFANRNLLCSLDYSLLCTFLAFLFSSAVWSA